MTDNSFLELKNVSFIYPDGTLGLDNIDLEITKGSKIAVIGGNGAGKSTLFLILNGINKPTKGKLFFNKKEITYKRNELLDLRKKVGIVFQDPDIQIFSASVFEEISFGLINIGIDKKEIPGIIERTARLLNISHLIEKPVHLLSFGQKKRVAIASIIAMNPEVLLLDEPTAGLDPKGVSELMNLLDDIRDNMNVSIVISTHDIDFVPVFCDQVYVMNRGKIHAKGTPDEIFELSDMIRSMDLRLPRINHLFEILKHKDNLEIEQIPNTISQAREAILKLINKRY
jgi:cobalt/nickel transport system ATP-binding protein